MDDLTIRVTYLTFYIITIIYFVMLGCYMLSQRANSMSTHGEQKDMLRMTRTMGVAMFVWAFECFIYLPPMLYGVHTDSSVYQELFLVSLMLTTPAVFNVMFAVVQRRVNILIWTCALAAPFLLLAILGPLTHNIDTACGIGAIVNILSMLVLLIMFASEYRKYVNRLKSEYSELSGRQIFWAWICFLAFAVQDMIFVIYEFMWSPLLEILYVVLSIVNATSLCFCICRQIPLDLDVVPEAEPEPKIDKQKEKVLYATIEEKLESNFKEKQLFLDPVITLETLAMHLSVNRTYLGMYLRSRNMSFYQYINTLRVEYAYQLMQDNPDMSIRSVSEQSGFRSQTTFRKVFREVKGSLPSEIRTAKN